MSSFANTLRRLIGKADEYNEPTTRREWKDAWNAREEAMTQEEQNRLAMEEHRLWAKHRTKEFPIYGTVEQSLFVPVYEGLKAAGILSGRSDPSIESMGAGFQGVGEGIGENVGDLLSRLRGDNPPAARPPSKAIPLITDQMSDEQIRAMALRTAERSQPLLPSQSQE